MELIKLDNISKFYGMGDATTVALDNLSFIVEKGEFVSIMGPSGSGKSTLMNIIGLLDTPTHGSYLLENKEVANLSQKDRARIRREKIGFIFQTFNLIPQLTVIENVALPLLYKGASYVKRMEAASKVLKSLDLGDREYYLPNQLSGGQRQRVAIARALINKPSLILADEPTGNVDSKTSENIMNILKDIHKKGNTILMVTHNPDLAEYGTRVIHVIDGQIEEKNRSTQNKKKATKKTNKKAGKK
ncbi:ABC transporter ATP-binding protein [Candidatus Saccharibacteria bacterium CPR2]|nr:ABC transporter ATP-binding protein [Candidatus Saccharibacteria bacterium CPR2]